jgi:excisionase family DNA binding protein
VVTVTQVMSRLNVSRSTVHHWIDEMELPALKIGRVTRIPVAALEVFLAAHQLNGGPPL